MEHADDNNEQPLIDKFELPDILNNMVTICLCSDWIVDALTNMAKRKKPRTDILKRKKELTSRASLFMSLPDLPLEIFGSKRIN
jgi:hypothetical protein